MHIQKPVYSSHSKRRPKIGFQDRLHVSLNAGQKYCRMLQGEHSAILSTFIKLPLILSLRSLFCLFLSGYSTNADSNSSLSLLAFFRQDKPDKLKYQQSDTSCFNLKSVTSYQFKLKGNHAPKVFAAAQQK